VERKAKTEKGVMRSCAPKEQKEEKQMLSLVHCDKRYYYERALTYKGKETQASEGGDAGSDRRGHGQDG
jgi:hypothetical protein